MQDLEHHGLRTAWLSQRVALALGLGAATAQAVADAARLHDIGKQFVAEEVLGKPGRLDSRERRHMEMHAVYGAWALMPGEGERPGLAMQVALLHHEWWNGRGYPFGLSGTAIPLAARITAVADVFDALVHERCYKPAWDHRDAMRYLRTQRDRQFDPNCADAMHEVAGQLPADWPEQALAGGRALPPVHAPGPAPAHGLPTRPLHGLRPAFA